MTQIDTLPPKSANPLRRWLDKRDISLYRVTQTLKQSGFDVTYERVRQISLERDNPSYCRPSWPLMAAIYRLTGGSITPNDWADPDEFPGLDPSS